MLIVRSHAAGSGGHVRDVTADLQPLGSRRLVQRYRERASRLDLAHHSRALDAHRSHRHDRSAAGGAPMEATKGMLTRDSRVAPSPFPVGLCASNDLSGTPALRTELATTNAGRTALPPCRSGEAPARPRPVSSTAPNRQPGCVR